MWRVAAPALLALALLACGDSKDGATPNPESGAAATSAGAPGERGGGPRISLEAAFGGRRFDRPTELGVYPGGRFFLADQGGLVSLLRRDGSDGGTLLDLRGRVLRGGNEEGLLSVALDPGFPGRPYLYAYYSAASPRRSVLSRFDVAGDRADLGSELVILEVAQPFSNHNGGAVRFGRDGMLYLGLGDGGGDGDPSENGQNLGALLAKILRIDVRDASEDEPYEVPRDNPFVGRPGARPEVWAYGFRNPWRMAFDPADGRLWVGDVGSRAVEEVDIVERGGNHGWNRLEGDQCHSPGTDCDRRGTVAPVASYTHADGCSITGGVVYRGDELPALAGQYLYADFCSGQIWALSVAGGEPVLMAGADPSRRIASFGVDEAGEVYLLNHGGPVLRIAGTE